MELIEVADRLAVAERITVLTGAGISTDSGIPDYRGPNGVWTRNPEAERLATYSDYVNDPEVRRRSWQQRIDHPAWSASPNAGHDALVRLEHSGRLRALITQNVDGLHQRAGSDAARVVEIHGTIWFSECVECADRRPMSELMARVKAGDPDPACDVCGGIVKSATISFGQALDAEVLNAAAEAAEDCDLFMAIGTSLAVHPAAGLCEVAVRAGAGLVIVNAEPTPYDDLADAVVREPIGDALPLLIGSVVG